MSDQVKRKEELIKAIDKATELAYEYFKNCDVGSERIAAGQVYENLRNAARVR